MAHIVLKIQCSDLCSNRSLNESFYKGLVVNLINSDYFRKYYKVTKLPHFLSDHTGLALVLQILIDVFEYWFKYTLYNKLLDDFKDEIELVEEIIITSQSVMEEVGWHVGEVNIYNIYIFYRYAISTLLEEYQKKAGKGSILARLIKELLLKNKDIAERCIKGKNVPF